MHGSLVSDLLGPRTWVDVIGWLISLQVRRVRSPCVLLGAKMMQLAGQRPGRGGGGRRGKRGFLRDADSHFVSHRLTFTWASTRSWGSREGQTGPSAAWAHPRCPWALPVGRWAGHRSTDGGARLGSFSESSFFLQVNGVICSVTQVPWE